MHLKFCNDNQLLKDIKGKPDPVSEITTATVLMIQKRCSSTVRYKNRHGSAIRVTDETPHYNTYYSISSCMGGMLFCNTRTVTWLAATSTNEISAADVFWTKTKKKRKEKKKKTSDKFSRGSKATDATTLENFHNDVEWRSNIDLVCSSGPLRWL